MNFTYNNHLKYTINDRLYGYREESYDQFKVTVGAIDKEYYATSNWLQEQYRTADIVSKEFGKDLSVMFSGGTDSEIVLRSFLNIGVTPNIYFIKFTNDANIGDYYEVQRVCKELNVKFNAIDFDVIDFYKSGAAQEFAKELQCSQLAYLSVYYSVLKLQMPSVMGGEMFLRRHVNTTGSRWYYCIRENEDCSAMRFSLKYNVPLVNEWFSYTPEMVLYYLENPDIQSLITTRYNYKLSSVTSKNKILEKLFPSVPWKIKTNGYEKMIGFNFEAYKVLEREYPKRLVPNLDGIYIDEVVKQLYGEV